MFVCVAARNAIVVVFAAVFAGILYHNSMIPFTLTSNITSGFPPWSAPQFEASHGNETSMSVSDTFQVSCEIPYLFIRPLNASCLFHFKIPDTII